MISTAAAPATTRASAHMAATMNQASTSVPGERVMDSSRNDAALDDPPARAVASNSVSELEKSIRSATGTPLYSAASSSVVE